MAIAPSFQDLLDQGIAEAQARRPTLLFNDGDISEAQMHGAAAMADAVIRFSAQSFRDTFIDGASGDALGALIEDHLNLPRNPATFAQATVALSRTSSGAGGTIPSGTVVATGFTADGETVEFATDADVIVPAADNGPFNVSATAVVAGVSGNVAVGAIDRVVDQPAFDPTFSVTNAAVAAGGNEIETDEAYRTRARTFYLTLRRGTLSALEFGAKQVSSVAAATATEDPVTGIVTVHVADSSGNSNLLMINDVIEELENWRCAGVLITVTGGTSVLVDIAISVVTARAGFNVAARSADIIAAVNSRFAKLTVGQTLYLDSLIGSVVGVAPDDIFDVRFDSITLTPGGVAEIVDVVPAAAEILRAGTITVS